MSTVDNFSSKQTDRITVIVPVYNTVSFLPRCIDSILGQTYQNTEIILVDDGSTDGSSEICDKYAASFSNIRVIHQENAGVSAARNTGMDYATGEYISFVDSDDWIHCCLLETLLAGIHETGAQICIAERKICRQDDNNTDSICLNARFEILDWEHITHMLVVKCAVYGRLYDCSIIEKIRFEEKLTFAEDRAFNLDVFCSQAEQRVAYTCEQLYYYFQRSDSAVHTIPHTKIFEVGVYCFEQADKMPSSWGRSNMLMEAVKDFLSARYALMFCNDKETKSSINKLIKKAIPRLMRDRNLSIKTRLIYLIFSLVPFFYRAFRITTDPTMRQWEKREKQMKRN